MTGVVFVVGAGVVVVGAGVVAVLVVVVVVVVFLAVVGIRRLGKWDQAGRRVVVAGEAFKTMKTISSSNSCAETEEKANVKRKRTIPEKKVCTLILLKA